MILSDLSAGTCTQANKISSQLPDLLPPSRSLCNRDQQVSADEEAERLLESDDFTAAGDFGDVDELFGTYW